MKPSKSSLLPLRIFIHNLLGGYHGWGTVRLVILIFLGAGLSMVWGGVLERETLGAIAEELKAHKPFLSWIPMPLMILLLTPFTWGSLRFYFIPIFAFAFALLLSARYLQDVYHLPDLRLSLHYLFACLFGIGYPTMRIGSQVEGSPPPDPSYLQEIGGPGYLDIKASHAVIVSRPEAASNIFGEGQHFLIRGEKVEEIADLNDQQDSIEKMSAFSYEGVAIQISDVRFGYRLKQTPPVNLFTASRAGSKPYAFSLQALRNLMQSRVITEQGLTDWRTMVKGMIRSTIQDFIYQHSVSELLRPPADYNPYTDLKNTFQSRALRERLRKMGTELLWINVGLFDFENEIYKQEYLKTWQPQGSPAPESADIELGSDIRETQDVGKVKAELIESLLKLLQQDSQAQGTLEKIQAFMNARYSSTTDA